MAAPAGLQRHGRTYSWTPDSNLPKDNQQTDKSSLWQGKSMRQSRLSQQIGDLRHLWSPLANCSPVLMSCCFPTTCFPVKCTHAVEKYMSLHSLRWPPSHSEQTTVKLQNKNKYKKKPNRLRSLPLIRTFQQQKETYWTATWHLFSPLLPPKFWYIWGAVCGKNTLSPPPSAVLPCCGGQRWRKERPAPFQPFLFGVKKDNCVKSDSTLQEAVDSIQLVLKLIKIRANPLCQNEWL